MDLLNELTARLQGLLYYSESEYPFSLQNWDKTVSEAIPGKIAALTLCSAEEIKEIASADFFGKMTRVIDAEDKAMVENAAKAEALYALLREHLSDLKVYRVEGKTQIPVFVTGMLRESGCIALQTTAIES